MLSFWLGDSTRADSTLDPYLRRWFGRDPILDRGIAERFGNAIAGATHGAYDHWARAARGRLALIILLDQFTRNVFRDSSQAYSGDLRAKSLCLAGLAIHADRELQPVERLFFYLPLLHAEDRAMQARSVACFTRLATEATGPQQKHFTAWLRTARRCRWIVGCFGRYPHRNTALGRGPTVSERLFLRAAGIARML